jgi:DNA repair exonuclease SbcCD nuclease subunit
MNKRRRNFIELKRNSDSDTWEVRGSTYFYRQEINEEGGFWDTTKKCYIFKKDPSLLVDEIQNKISQQKEISNQKRKKTLKRKKKSENPTEEEKKLISEREKIFESRREREGEIRFWPKGGICDRCYTNAYLTYDPAIDNFPKECRKCYINWFNDN